VIQNRKKVKAIIVDKLGVEESEVTPEASFTNDLGYMEANKPERQAKQIKKKDKSKPNKH
jgi:hypothetical protein